MDRFAPRMQTDTKMQKIIKDKSVCFVDVKIFCGEFGVKTRTRHETRRSMTMLSLEQLFLYSPQDNPFAMDYLTKKVGFT